MGIFQKLSSKVVAMWKHAKDKRAFFRTIIEAASDGRLTEEEIAQIELGKTQLGLTDDDLKRIQVQAYSAALAAATSDGKVTPEEERELNKLQAYFQISDDSISQPKQQLARFRLLAEIQEGNLPTAQVVNVIFQKGEQAHWAEAGNILEERVVGRRYQGGSNGVSIRIAKGVSYRVGAHRGNIVTDKAVVPVSSGELILTNKRTIFRGDKKSFVLSIPKLLDVSFFTNGVKLTDDKGKPRTVMFKTKENVDIVGAVLSRVINDYSSSR